MVKYCGQCMRCVPFIQNMVVNSFVFSVILPIIIVCQA